MRLGPSQTSVPISRCDCRKWRRVIRALNARSPLGERCRQIISDLYAELEFSQQATSTAVAADVSPVH